MERDLVFVRGSVPGPQGGIIRMVDSRKASTIEQADAIYDLPLPTMFEAPLQTTPDLIVPLRATDPLNGV